MNYERKQESRYAHHLFERADGSRVLLLGASKEMSAEEAAILVSSPMIMYPSDFWECYFRLNMQNRSIINATLQQIGEIGLCQVLVGNLSLFLYAAPPVFWYTK